MPPSPGKRAPMPSLPNLSGSIGLNIFNHESVRHISSRFGMVTLSPELSRDEIRLLIHASRLQGCSPSFALIVQGSNEAMVSEDCILQPRLLCNEKKDDTDTHAFFGIMDATGHTFPVRIDGECRSHIYNSAEICLIDHLPSLMQIGINEGVIDARGRTAAYAREMVHIYRDAISKARQHNTGIREGLIPLKKRVKEIALGGITAGHFERGLKSHET